MLKIVTLCLIAIQITQQSCVKGCLKCVDNADKSAKICSICDFLNKYVQDEAKTGCVLSTVENCSIFGDSGCLVCNPDHLLDAGKCVAITTKIANCSSYSSQTVCQVCDQNSFVSDSKCTVITTLINNCQVYTNATTCSQCQTGYELVSNECKSPTNINNCIGYTNFECKTCDSGFISNPNLYIDANAQSMFTVLRTGISSWTNVSAEKHILDLARCQTITNFATSNCALFETFDKCQVCNTGYFLTSTKTCQKNADDRIENCSIYTNINTCKSCAQGYILSVVNSPNNTCQLITDAQKKQNCAEYSTTLSSVVCTKCSDDYYVSNGNCAARTVQADNANYMSNTCQTFNETADQCVTCKTGRSLAESKTHCVTTLANCTKYNNDGDCTECNRSSHYLSNGECLSGNTDIFCATFEVSSNSCDVCQTQYYDNCEQSQKHQPIDNCTAYNFNEPWKCSTCADGFALIQHANYCQDTYTKVDNCKTFVNGLCSACNTGFYLKSGDPLRCQALTNNCSEGAEKTGDTNVIECSACNDGFYLESNSKTCVEAKHFVSEYCLDGELSGTNLNDAVCDVCANNALNIDLNNTHVCIADSRIKLHLGIDTFTGLSKCEQYATATTCERCEDDSFLFTDGTCKTNCNKDNDTKIYPYDVFTINGGAFEKYKTCKTGTLDGDKELVYAPSAQDGSQIVVKCVTESFSTVPSAIKTFATDPDYSNVNPDNTGTTSSKFVEHPTDVHPILACKTKTGAKINRDVALSGNVSATGCHYWADGANAGEYDCFRCPFGLVPNGEETTDNFIKCKTGSTSPGFTNARNYNLNAFWSFYFSVHHCSDSTKIPVYVLDHDQVNVTKFAKFAFGDGTAAWTAATTGFDDPLTCINVTDGATFKVDTKLSSLDLTTNFSAMTGCGLGVLQSKAGDTTTTFDNTNWNNNTDPADGKRSLICAACANGYKATEYTGKKHVACTVIDNCDSNNSDGKMFNGCFKCAATHTHAWNSTDKEIDYSECVLGTKTNCISGVLNNSVFECKSCAMGFTLNSDGNCIKITTPKCADSFNALWVSANEGEKIGIYRHQKGTGCYKCEATYSAFKVTTNASVCALNTTLQNAQTTVFADGSDFINYCQNYKNNATEQCHKCYDDEANATNRKVINNTGNLCVSQGINNCKISIADNQCQECLQGPYFLDNDGKCIQNNAIANCMEYNVNTVLTKLQCSKCQDTYYLKNDNNESKCLKGYIANCKSYNSQFECSECDANFLLFSSTGTNASYCIAKPTNRCTTYTFTTNNTATCASCEAHQSLLSPTTNNFSVKIQGSTDPVTEPLNECLAFNTISNCKTYSHTTTFTTPFPCVECDKDFWLVGSENGYLCKSRSTINNCATYNTNENKCQTCSNGFYLADVNGQSSDLADEEKVNQCIAYPNGVLGCQIYKDENTCEKCDSGRFLNTSGKCELADAITRCVDYSSKTTCGACEAGYFKSTTTVDSVEKETCEKGPSNCIVAKSATVCETCSSGYWLNNSLCEINGVSNCLTYNGTTQVCEQCENQRYFENGTCILQDNVNCTVFTSKEVCSVCNDGYTLLQTGKCQLSNTKYDANCQFGIVPTSYQCSFCNVGYKFDADGKTCVKIDNFESGCLFANLTDSSCNICSPNFYMNDSFKCIANTTGGGDNDDDGGVGVLSGLFAILALLFVQLF